MRRILFLAIFFALTLQIPSASAVTAVWCGFTPDNKIYCSHASNSDPQSADNSALPECTQASASHSCFKFGPLENSCTAIGVLRNTNQIRGVKKPTAAEAIQDLSRICQQQSAAECNLAATICDPPVASNSSFNLKTTLTSDWPSLFQMSQIASGLSFGLGLIIALLIYAKRIAVANFIIHNRLPYTLPIYGEDIQCLFKRTQRVNWYGRIVFGIVANFSMTHDQLMDVRKYWLGRVVAFDSLRRQRQNQLAKMHLQLAASAKSDAYDKKNFWSRRWATVRTFLRRLFWIFAALFRLLFSFLFIRVNIAKLVRGTIIESKDLTLVLQAKEAIEESATYLKEYLDTANTFDGRDEVA